VHYRVSQTSARFHCLALIALMLWLGGVGCATCCARERVKPHVTQATAGQSFAAGMAASADSSEEMDCCKQKAAKHRPATTKPATIHAQPAGKVAELSEPLSVAACSLLPKHTSGFVTLKMSPDDVAADLAQRALPFICPDAVTKVSASPLALPLNRSGTYLRCCVLLI